MVRWTAGPPPPSSYPSRPNYLTLAATPSTRSQQRGNTGQLERSSASPLADRRHNTINYGVACIFFLAPVLGGERRYLQVDESGKWGGITNELLLLARNEEILCRSHIGSSTIIKPHT